jgi:hypothetical protein
MFEEPELHFVKFPGDSGWRAEQQRQREEGRQRYRDRLLAVLPLIESISDLDGRAEAILDHLFVVTRISGDGDCRCSCHPRLPDSDFHDYGLGCSCRLTADERKQELAAWEATLDAYDESPEGRAEAAARQVEEDELISWLAASPDVVVTSYGGMFPEQWWGSVDGHSFCFRERHGNWRIELDLRPSGHFVRAWAGGDLDDDANFEVKETEVGDIIAEGTTRAIAYGETPAERAAFIVEKVRCHLRQQRCEIHTIGCHDLELLFGRPIGWCPACGARL